MNHKVTVYSAIHGYLTSYGIFGAQYISDAQGNVILDEDGFVTYVDVKGL